MTKSQEWVLIEKCKRGDVAAYTDLVRKYQDVIYNCAWRILANSEDAADVTQIAFLKLYEHIGSFDSSRTFFSWMYRIAVNEALDHRRKDKSFQSMAADNIESNSENPEQILETVAIRDHIQASLLKLSDDSRVVIVLRHFNELSYREMGDILEISEKTVKSRLYSARQRLRELLLTKDSG